MNPYFNQFRQRLAEKYSIDAKNMSMSEWICRNTTIRGKPFSFDDGYQFQREILDDMHPDLAVKKLSQVGMTEGQIRKALGFLVRNQGTSLIYAMPDLQMRDRISAPRVKPIVNRDPVFAPPPDGARGVTRTKDMMQFDQSFLYLTANVEADATSIPADFVMNDELDLSDQEIVALMASRLQNSNWKIRQQFSTPTFAAFGISLVYDVSDQREYFYRCQACNKWQIPMYSREWVTIPGLPDHVVDLRKDMDEELINTLDFTKAFVRCCKCHRPLDLTDHSSRQWVATHPERINTRGYQIRPFSTHRVGIPYIIRELFKYQQKGFIRRGINTVLGEEYTDKNSRLERVDIVACLKGTETPDVSRDIPVFAGIDMGMTCHITLGAGTSLDNFRVIKLSTCHIDDLPTAVSEIDRKYRLVGGAVDRHPYTPSANAIRDLTGGRIMPLEYRGTIELNPKKAIEDPDTIIHWQADRTTLLDEVATRVREHTLPIFGYGTLQEVLIEHLRDMVRDDDPDSPATWRKMNGNDHFFHSLGLLLSSVKIKKLKESLSNEEPRVLVLIQGVETNQDKNKLIGYTSAKADQPIGAL